MNPLSKILVFTSLCFFSALFSQNYDPVFAIDNNQGGSLVSIDPVTGNSTLLVAGSIEPSLELGHSTIDAVNSKFYLLTGDLESREEFLCVYDYANGTFTQIQIDLVDDYRMWNLWLDPSTGDLISIPRQQYPIPQSGLPAGNYVVRIDPNTGAITRISNNPIGAPLSAIPALNNATYNPDQNKVYYFAATTDPDTFPSAKVQWFVVDVNTGNLTSATEQDFPNLYGGQVKATVYNPGDSLVYGMFYGGTTTQLVQLDPATGDILMFGDSLPGYLTNGYPAINADEGVYTTFARLDTTGGISPVKLDFATLNLSDGSVRTQFPIPTPSNYGRTFSYLAYPGCYAATADFSADLAQLFQPSTFTFTGIGTNVQWDFGDPTTTTDVATGDSATYTYTEAGNYTITVIAEGCDGFDTLSLTVSVGVSTVASGGPGLPASLSPNPGDQQVELFFNETDPGTLSLTIYSQEGLPVFSTQQWMEGQPQSMMLPTGKIRDGLYFIRMEKNGEMLMKKLLVRH